MSIELTEDSMSAAEAKLSIGFVLDSLEGGGAERIMVELATRISMFGHSATLIVGDATGPWRSLVPRNVRIVDLKAHSKLKHFLRLVAALRRERADVLLVTGPPSVAFTLAAKAAGLVASAVVVRERSTPSHGLSASRYRLANKPILRFLYRYADRAVCLCEDARKDFLRTFLFAPEKVVTIYNAAAPNDERAAELPSAHPFFDDRDIPILLSVGRLAPEKDLITLLRAFQAARARRPLRLIILGEGSERPKLEAFVATHGLSNAVSLPGFRRDAPTFLCRCDLFVLSSIYEGMPNALLQALMIGSRVVSMNCPSGPREILDDGRYGQLVPVGDWRALAEAVLASLDKPPPVLEQAFIAKFSPDRAARSYVEVLAAAVEDVRTTARARSLKGQIV
jgi:glycosyltransferase involved in cell wall biosynthesis